MADTSWQVEYEDWVRREWMPTLRRKDVINTKCARLPLLAVRTCFRLLKSHPFVLNIGSDIF